MNNGDVPDKFPIPWGVAAGGAYIRPIPVNSQIGVNDGWASLTDGFVPLNMVPLEAGGIPPFGQDMNGILNQITQWAQWLSAGAPVIYDAAFAAAIGGYPKGAILQAVTLDHQWLCLVDANATDPDAGGAGWVRWGRIRLTANTNFYIDGTTGNDANDGLTVGTPWATLQHGWDVLQANYDLGGFTASFICTGAFTAGAVLDGTIPGQSGADGLIFRGDLSTPANVPITVNATACFTAYAGAVYTVLGFKFIGTGSCFGLAAADGGFIRFANCDFGEMPTGTHIGATASAIVECVGDYTISGDATLHLSASASGGNIRFPPTAHTITLVGVPAFSRFASSGTTASIYGPFSGVVTFVGTATGQRYFAEVNGVINTSGGGANFFPGNAAGAVQTGGQYV